MQGRTPLGMQNALTIDATSGGIALTMPSGAKPRGAVVSIFTAPIRFTVDGTAPTTTLGHRGDVNDVIELDSSNEVVKFKAIRETGVSASLEVTFYG